MVPENQMIESLILLPKMKTFKNLHMEPASFPLLLKLHFSYAVS